jgi:hypothetical protein
MPWLPRPYEDIARTDDLRVNSLLNICSSYIHLDNSAQGRRESSRELLSSKRAGDSLEQERRRGRYSRLLGRQEEPVHERCRQPAPDKSSSVRIRC